MDFSPDGKLLVASPLNGSSVIWNVATGKVWGLLTGRKGQHDARFSADGRYIATTDVDNVAYVFDTTQAKFEPALEARVLSPVEELHGHGGRIRALKFSKDSRSLITASEDGAARLWDVETGTMTRIFKGHRSGVVTAAFDPTASRVLTGSTDGTARIWRADHADNVVMANEGIVTSVSFDDRGDRLLSVAPQSRTVRLWRAKDGSALGKIDGHKGPVQGAAFIAAGTRIVTLAGERGDDDNLARIFTADQQSLLATVQGTRGPFKQIAVSRTGAHLALVESRITNQTENTWNTENDDRVLLVDAMNPSEQRLLLGHADGVTRVRFSPGGKLLASASYDRTVRLWNVATGAAQLVLTGHESSTTDIAFSPDGATIATSSVDKTVRIWRLADGMLLHVLRGHQGWVNSVVFSSDGKRLVASVADFGQDNQELRVWDPNSGKQVLKLEANVGAFGMHAEFSPDGRRLLTVGVKLQDKTGKALRSNVAEVWDTTSGDRIVTVDYGSVQAAKFDATGDWLVVASTDGTVRMLRIFPTTQAVVARAKHVARRCMTRQDREKAFLSPTPPGWCNRIVPSGQEPPRN